MGRGILVRTAFLARQASTSKCRLNKGSRAVLKPDRAPSSHSSPQEACSPVEDPGRSLLGDTTSVTRQGQEGRCPHHSLNRVGCGEREGVPAGHPSMDSPAHPPQPAPGTSFTSMLALPRYRAEGGEGNQG